jgi:hypothetical protein
VEYNVITRDDAGRVSTAVVQPARAAGLGGPAPGVAEARVAATPLDRDDALDRLFKFIPSITVGTYLAIQGVVVEVADEEARKWTLLVVFLVLAAGTWLYLSRRNVKRLQQLLASLGAFVLWVFALGGPFDLFWEGWESWMGSVALFLGAFLLTAWKPDPLPER